MARWVSLIVALLSGAGPTGAQRLGTIRLTVGTAGGPDETVFSGVLGASVVNDSMLAVLDGTRHRIVFFNMKGQHVGTAGREGEGPGEFRIPRWMDKCSDRTLAIYDAGLKRITRFDAEGKVLATFLLPQEVANFDLPVWCGSGNHVFVLANRMRHIAGSGERPRVPVFLLSIIGSVTDTVIDSGVQDYYISARVRGYTDVPLGRSTLAGVGRTIGAMCTAHDGVCRVFDTVGTVLTRWVAPVPRELPLQEGDWQRVIRGRVDVEHREATRVHLARILPEIPAAKTFPAFDQIQVDDQDRIWLRTYEGYHTPEAKWAVLNRDGRLLVNVMVPRTVLRVLEIGPDYLLGLQRDSDEVEQVVMYGIRQK